MERVKRERRIRNERRFTPRSAMHPRVLMTGIFVSALTLGAGVYARFFAEHEIQEAPYVLAAGVLLFGIMVWLATSGDLMIRVGSGGVAIDRETLQRIPWHQVEAIRWDEKRKGVLVTGKDESHAALEIIAPLRTHPFAAAWIVKEAEARVPKRVQLSEEERNRLVDPSEKEGETLQLDELQVVGKKCAKSRRAIAYAKDARVCPRCERIYHRKSVPEKCACGADLADLAADQVDDGESTDEAGAST